MIGYNLRNHGACNGFKASTSVDDESGRQYVPGDIAWIKIHGSSWWPTQVVDEKSLAVRPKKKRKDDILVRLYGSYKYLYVNPLKCMEFESIANKESINVKEEFQKALEKELSCIISKGNSNGKSSDFRENPMAVFPRDKMPNQAGTAKNSNPVASLPGASFSEPYEANEEGHVMKHMTEADDNNGAQNSSPTRKARTDVSEANGYKQRETDSNKKRKNGSSRYETKDQDILRQLSCNKAKKDKHVAAGHMEEADEKETQKSIASGKVTVDASEATDKKQGEAKENQGNRLSKINTINQGILRRSPRNNTNKEVAKAVNLIRTSEECMLELSDSMQKGNDVDTELKDSRQSFASVISGEKNTKQSEMSSLENRTSQVKVTRRVLKKCKRPNVHEEAKRLVIIELAKHRGTVNHESQTSELKGRPVNGNLGVQRSQQNDSVQTEINQTSEHKSVKRREAKRQYTNDGINGHSDNTRQNDSTRRMLEKSWSTQSPCTTSNHSPEEIGDISSRKTRVMQSLGLVAPPGSPFRRNGLVQGGRLKI